MKTNAIASKSRQANRRTAGTKAVMKLACSALAVGASVCLNAQEQVTNSITKSVLLEWPVPAEECIVVGATSLTSIVWTLTSEPIYQHLGKLRMAVPVTNPEQFFKVVPGTQLIDDFDPPKWPYATKGDWVPYFYTILDSTPLEVTNVNQALRIRTLAPAVDGRIFLLPPGPEVVVGDFYASVDITDWPVPARSFGIVARGQWTGSPLTSNGYMGLVGRNPDEIRIWNGSEGVPGRGFTYDPAKDYRLAFSGVGTDLLLCLWDLTTGVKVCEMPLYNGRWNQGMVGLWGNVTAGGSGDITLDNFFVTGTKR